MRPERAFYDLQVRFARAAARLTDMPLGAALLDCTNLYVRFGAGRGFDAAHPLWEAYLSGINRYASEAAQCEWTWRHVQRCQANETYRAGPAVVATFGCFSYAREPHGGLRLHFNAQADNGLSPLDIRRFDARRDELRRLIDHLRAHLHESGDTSRDPLVHGTSWLYNLPAYRRLFPAVYVASAQPVARLRALSLWGQFLDRRGCVRKDSAAKLLAQAERERDFARLVQCFPVQALAVHAPVSAFRADFTV